MGKPTSYGVFVEANGQGWYQRFEHGVVYGSYQGGTAFIPANSTLAEYNRQGGPAGGLGWPNGEQVCDAAARCQQSFVSASISSTTEYGAHTIWGGLNNHWKANGSTDGPLGAALNDVAYRTGGREVAWVQHFQQGVLVESPRGIFVVPYGPIGDAWSAAGSGEGWLGWPAAPLTCEAASCAQTFADGVISWSASYGAHFVSGGFVAEWQRRGGLGTLGSAYNDMTTSTVNGGGWVQNFVAGILTQSSAGGFAFVPYGPGQALWTASGSQFGGYGWPVADRVCVDAGCGQTFQFGAITESSWGTHPIIGGFVDPWKAAGGVGGYGPALNDLRYSTHNGGGWAQHYSSGVLTQRRGGVVVYSPYGRIIDLWYYYGAETSWLGWPDGPQSCDSAGCVQQFQNGVARSDAAGNVSFLPR